MTLTIKDTYQAAYYYMNGGRITDAKVHKVQFKKQATKMIKNEWYITLENVPDNCIESWKNGNAIANIKDLATSRSKVKRKVKDILLKKEW